MQQRAARREMRKGELERQIHQSLGMARNLSSVPMLGKCAGLVEQRWGVTGVAWGADRLG